MDKTIPKVVVKSVAGGLLLMAFFTLIWAGIASGGQSGTPFYLIVIIFGIICCTFVAYAIFLFKASKNFAELSSDEDKAKGKKIGMWYGIIFGAEGVIIPIVCCTLVFFKQEKFIVPAIALIVGLHFYPMAKVFNRTIDYYLASWTCLVALAAIYFTEKATLPEATVFLFLGIGVAVATTGYGIYMIYAGKGLLADTRVAQP
jgi:hypothetical protein